MNAQVPPLDSNTIASERRMALLRALNAAAASLQRSAHSESEVFRAVKEQIVELGLRGSLCLLNEAGDRLVFRAVAYPGRKLVGLERLIGLRAEGFEFTLEKVNAFRLVVESGESVFVAETRDLVAQILPEVARPFAKRIFKDIGNVPSIFAPIITEGRVQGVLNVSGAGLTEGDIPPLEAFANHVAVALDNARLFAAVRQAEAEYRRLFESASDGILIIDPASGRILSANPKAAEMADRSEAELLTEHIFSLYPSHVAEEVRRQFELVCDQGWGVFDMPLARRDGRECLVQVSATMFEVDGRLLMQSVMRDITERVRAERVRAASNHISEAALSASSLDALYRSIHESIDELMPAKNFYIALYDESTKLLSFPYFVDERDEWSPPQKPDKGLTAYVLRTGKPLLASPEVFEELVRQGEVELIGAPSIDWLGVPLKTQETTIGVLAVQTYAEGVRFTEENKDILTFVSTQVALAIARRRAEQALRESEARLNTAIESWPFNFWVRDAEGRYVMQNSVSTERWGNLVGKRLEDLDLSEDTLRQWQENNQRAYAGEVVQEEVEYAVNGEKRYAIKTVSPIRDDEDHIQGIMGITVDITDRKCAEEALRASEERFRALIENSTDLITLIGADGTILYASPSTTRVLGYAPEEYIGRSGFERIHPAEIEDLTSVFSELIQRPGGVVSTQYRFCHKDGSWRWMEGVSKNMLAEPGVRAIVVNSRDVTERKRAEEALRQAQKLESLGVLAGGVAHDFNNLLVAMLGQASLALRQLSAENPARGYVEKVVSAAERAADLTRQMLAYSGGGQFEMRPIRLNALLHENLHLFEVAVPKNVHLHSELTEPLPLIEGDVGQMQQVIMNLIINAAEAIGERPGTVLVTTGAYTVRAKDDRLWQHTGEPLVPGEYVMLEVRDNGSGMDAETVSKIFDPFFTTKFTGRGLGLAAVLGIVRGHAGGLHVESALGRGTAFQLYFPAIESKEVAPIMSTPTEAAGAMHGLILVIDDEAPVREAVTDILEMEGLQVITAATGQRGIELYRDRAGDVSLILLDLSMPGLSGEETFLQLRQIDPGVRVLLSSGYNQAEATEHFTDQGLLGFIQKPYDATTLLREVRRHLT